MAKPLLQGGGWGSGQPFADVIAAAQATPGAVDAQLPDETDWQYFWRRLGAGLGYGAKEAGKEMGGNAIGAIAGVANSTPNKRAGVTPEAAAAAKVKGLNDFFDLTPQNAANRGVPLKAVFDAQTAIESGGRAGIKGPMTQYGQAEGLKQVLPSTGEATAKAHGLTWRPELMTATSPEAVQYQQAIGNAVMFDNLARTGGDIPAALAQYHGGTDESNWGPKTANYVQNVLDKAGSEVGLGDLTSPGFSFVDPRAAMGLIPLPKALPQIDLPDAPQEEMPGARPHKAVLDLTSLLAPLTAAYAPVPVDHTGDPWERFQQWLGGAAQGYASGGGLAGAGAGALAGFTKAKAGQKGEDKAFQEQQRQAAIALAQAGFGLNHENVDRGDANAAIDWQSGEDARTTKFGNLGRKDQRQVQEQLTNEQIMQKNIENLNQAYANRGQVGIHALDAAAGAQNAANSQQLQINLGLSERELQAAQRTGLTPGAASVLKDVGVPVEKPSGSKANPLHDNAREAASYIDAGNTEGMIGSLANEAVLSGEAVRILSGDPLKTYKKAVQQKDLAGAQAVMAQAFAGNPKLAQEWAVELAKRGLPVATMVAKRVKKPDASTANQ